jgi:C1A family cysteine protease
MRFLMNYLPVPARYALGITQSSLPSVVDLRPKCSPIANQGDMSSCVAFAVISAMEYLENVQHNSTISLSQQFVYYNERVLNGSVASDDGAFVEDGINVLLTYGACELSLWPYSKDDLYTKPSDAAYADATKRKALKYSRVAQDQTSVMTPLSNGYPVVLGFLVYPAFESQEVAASGIVPMPNSTEEMLGGHCVCIVGYDLAKQMFLIRNSWGPDWGINGYCWMPFAYVLSPSLAHGMYAIESVS